jgi:hypothetical protein
LNDKSPVVEQQRAQPGKLFAAAGSSRAAVQTARHNISVAGVLSADAGVDDHDSPMQITDAEHNALEKFGIIRKNRSDERTKPASRNRNEILDGVVCDERRHWAEDLNVVHKFRV